MKTDTDPYVVHSKCLTYEAWAALEAQNGFAEASGDKVNLARNCYNSLPPQYPRRQEYLDGLDRRVVSAQRPPGRELLVEARLIADIPVAVRTVLANASAKMLMYILNNELGQITSDALPESPEKEIYDELVRARLCDRLSKKQLREEAKKRRNEPKVLQNLAFGLSCGLLYEQTHSVLTKAVPDMIDQLRQQSRLAR